jgi:type II secretory ATPase GspE/PulE/Tfp pilus assembly ATPase PilB-like protein
MPEDEVALPKSEYSGLKYESLENFSRIEWINYHAMEKHVALPFREIGSCIHVAVGDPEDVEAMDAVNQSILASCADRDLVEIVYYIANKSDILRIHEEIKDADQNSFASVIVAALKENASDIHVTPFEKEFTITFRIDGDLVRFQNQPISNFEQLSISIKVSANLDISETRRPQSGHCSKMDNIDLRISTHPTVYGENIVIRILSKERSMVSIENLGFDAEKINYLKEISSYSSGMIIFCGPTGSGKTTSIYSLIETMDKDSRNIVTLEDPVEYKIQGVRQTEIKEGVIDFADGVRSVLRQDPDVIMIGEIRDEKTAKMAVRASMTGHLVLTTIHSNDSFCVITRMRELGISLSLISENVIAIVAQRLVKKVGGGRCIISEILKFSHELCEAVSNGYSKQRLLECSRTYSGFKSMAEDMSDKLSRGIALENKTIRLGL